MWIYNMKVSTYIKILDVFESKIFKYTKSAFFWLSFASIIFSSLPFKWWYMLIVILFNICYIWINAYFIVRYDDDKLYNRYDPTGKLKNKIRGIKKKKAP